MCKAPLARTFCLAATSHPREEVLLCQSVWGMGGRGEVGEVGGGPGDKQEKNWASGVLFGLNRFHQLLAC